jgi:pilus assembly protein Flp/PilA
MRPWRSVDNLERQSLTFVAEDRAPEAPVKMLKLNIKPVLTRFLHEASGATAVEYAVIATIIGVGIVVGISTIPDALNTFFNNASDALQ